MPQLAPVSIYVNLIQVARTERQRERNRERVREGEFLEPEA